jgi:hypothetical protein
MSKFTIRVVLHDATWEDYVNLAKALAKIGVVDRISGSDGVTYQLPDAEYTATSDLSCGDMRDRVVQVVKTATKREHAVLVSLSTERCWVGLKRAN